jgi:hypothetical protein
MICKYYPSFEVGEHFGIILKKFNHNRRMHAEKPFFASHLPRIHEFTNGKKEVTVFHTIAIII